MNNYTSKINVQFNYKLPSNANPKEFNDDTKSAIILDMLLSGKVITVANAALIYNIFCLSQLVSHLRHHKNIPIKTKMQKKMGQTGKYAEYFLTKSDIAEILKKEFQL